MPTTHEPEDELVERLLHEPPDESAGAGVLAGAPRRTDRSRDLRALGWLLGCVALLVVSAFGAVAWAGTLVPQVDRIEGAFAGLENRPAAVTGPAAAALDVLVLGTDRRSDVPTTGEDAAAAAWEPGAQRSDSMMLVHVDADRRGVSVVSLPRDAWVEVPGHGPAKINAAYSYGGVPLAVETFETLTGVRVDHVAVVDGDGFAALTDAAGGVTVEVPETVTDRARDVTWEAGTHHLDGAAALDYVGQRYGLPRGDLDRARRQQAVLRTVLSDLLRTGMRSDPALLGDFVDTVLAHVSVDEEWSAASIAALAVSLRDLRSADIRFLVAPVASFGQEGDQSVVRLDDELGGELWTSVRDDRLDGWLAQHPDSETPETVS